MFRRAAGELPDYFSSEQYWPKYALLTHAIELSLKAFHSSLNPEWEASAKQRT
jgi:hypothetical protein